jgi:hypothetical protein
MDKAQYKARSRYRETLLVIVLGFALLYLVFDRNWMLYAALGLGITGIISVRLNRLIHIAWLFIGDKVGFLVGKVVLAVIFLCILLPVSLLSRLFRKDLMNLRSPRRPRYHQRDHLYTPDDFVNMW